MVGFTFSNMMREMTDTRAVSRVLDALRLGPMSAEGLVKALNIREAIVVLAISVLRRNNYSIENCGWRSGKGHHRKGTYHLVKEPVQYPGSAP